MISRHHCSRYFSDLAKNIKIPNDFSFQNIHKHLKNRHKKSININEDHRKLFYIFLRHTNTIVYSYTKIKRNDHIQTPSNLLLLDDVSNTIESCTSGNVDTTSIVETNDSNLTLVKTTEDIDSVYIDVNTSWLCRKIERILSDVGIDNRIILLQRSLAVWYYTSGLDWYKLITRILRFILSNDMKWTSTQSNDDNNSSTLQSNDINSTASSNNFMLTPSHLVKIYASLSKWRFKNTLEFDTKFDISILSQSEWDIYNSSQILWSLAHLKRFYSPSFDYLNNKIIDAMNSLEITIGNINDATMHRIISANLMRISHTGVIHPINNSLISYFTHNIHLLKCLSNKTLVSLSSILPYTEYNDDLTFSILQRIDPSLYQFTCSQAIQLFYSLSIISDNISSRSLELIINLLYDFKEFLFSSDIVLLPTMSCKTLYINRVFLGKFDPEIVNKCISDSGANLHLLEPFSLLGNLQALKLYSKEEKSNVIDHYIKNVIIYNDGQLMKKLMDGGVVELSNVKLWHYALLSKITGKDYNLYKHLYDFTIGHIDGSPSDLKSFTLFLLYACAYKAPIDKNLISLILIASCKLWSICDGKSFYWDVVRYYMTMLEIGDAFEREVKTMDDYTRCTTGPQRDVTSSCTSSLQHDVSSTHTSSRLLLEVLKLMLRGDEDEILKIISSMDFNSNESLAKVLILKFIVLNSYANGGEISKMLQKVEEVDIKERLYLNFHQAMPININSCRQKLLEGGVTTDGIKILELIRRYTVPLYSDMLYTKIFFLQDYPQLMMNIIPALCIDGLINTRVEDFSLKRLADWFNEQRNYNSLKIYLENCGTMEKSAIIDDYNVEGDIVEVYSNCGDLPEPLVEVKRNCYIGPYLSSFMLSNGINKIFIFIFPVKSPCILSIHNKIRRSILRDYKIIEFHNEMNKLV